jgi:hypothetical protein
MNAAMKELMVSAIKGRQREGLLNDEDKLEALLEQFAKLVVAKTLDTVCNARVDAIANFEISGRQDLNKFLVATSSVAMVSAVNECFGIDA